MYYTRQELFAKYKENNDTAQRYFHKAFQWKRYSKEERDTFWNLYQKYDDIAYQYLLAATACALDGVLFVAYEEFK